MHHFGFAIIARIDPQGSEHLRYTQFPVLAASRVSFLIFFLREKWDP